MNRITYISFCTEGYYEKVMDKYLRPSLERWELPHKIYVKKSHKNWMKNTEYKAKIILEALNTFNTDLVFIDADGTVEKKPHLLYDIAKRYHIAVHYLDWYKHWRNTTGTRKELLSGTMFIRNNDMTKELIEDWIEFNKKIKQSQIEQKNLDDLLKQKPKIQVYNLPVEYCVVPKHDNSIPDYIGEPVILHHQVSRITKKDIKKL